MRLMQAMARGGQRGLGLLTAAALLAGCGIHVSTAVTVSSPAAAMGTLTRKALPAHARPIDLVVSNHSWSAISEVTLVTGRRRGPVRYSVVPASDLWSAFSALPMPSQQEGLIGWQLGRVALALVPRPRGATLWISGASGMALSLRRLGGVGSPPHFIRRLATRDRTLEAYGVPMPTAVSLVYRPAGTTHPTVLDLKLSWSPPPPLALGSPQILHVVAGWPGSWPAANPVRVAFPPGAAHEAIAAVFPAGVLLSVPHGFGLLTWQGRYISLLRVPGALSDGWNPWAVSVGTGPWALLQGPAPTESGDSSARRPWWWWNIATGALSPVSLANIPTRISIAGGLFAVESNPGAGVYTAGQQLGPWPSGLFGNVMPSGVIAGWQQGRLGVYDPTRHQFQPTPVTAIDGHVLTPTLPNGEIWLPVWGPTIMLWPGGHQPWPNAHTHLASLSGAFPPASAPSGALPTAGPFLVQVTQMIEVGWPDAAGQLTWRTLGQVAFPEEGPYDTSWDGLWWQGPTAWHVWHPPGPS